MSLTRIKICGLRTLDDINVANEIHPDYVGFVFAMKKREVTEEEAYQLRKVLDASIPAVGVFVNADNERIIRLLNNQTIQFAQLHGSETEEDIIYIKQKTGKPVIKAVVVHSQEDIYAWLNSSADYLLFDSGTGSGITFDWSQVGQISRPFFLAGGLNPENIAAAIQQIHPYCVDLSSGVETYPGSYRKDPAKMREVVNIVRNTAST